MNLSKLESKYEANMENEENILNDLQYYINEVTSLKDKLHAF
jgi:hypothetical protein